MKNLITKCLNIDDVQVDVHSDSLAWVDIFPDKEAHYFIIDTETGGLDHKKDALCSVSAIFANKNFEPFVFYHTNIRYNNKKRYGVEAERIHGILTESLKDEKLPTLEEAYYDLLDIIKVIQPSGSKIIPVGHNVSFDLNFLNLRESILNEIVHPYRKIDTAGIALIYDSQASLDTLYKYVFNNHVELPAWCNKVYGEPEHMTRDIHHSLFDAFVCNLGCYKAKQQIR